MDIDTRTLLEEANANIIRLNLDNSKLRDVIVELIGAKDAANKDYGSVVSKFDECRAALARVVEDRGLETTPPDEYKGSWHEWLISQL